MRRDGRKPPRQAEVRQLTSPAQARPGGGEAPRQADKAKLRNEQAVVQLHRGAGQLGARGKHTAQTEADSNSLKQGVHQESRSCTYNRKSCN